MSDISTKQKGGRSQADRSDSTRQALITTGIRLFANKGFSEVSNRQLSSAAGVNQALIGYHFGNKDGLYQAIFEQIAADLGNQLMATTSTLAAELAELKAEIASLTTPLPPQTHERCVNAVLRLLNTYANLLLDPEVEDYAKLILREQFAPTPMFTLLWESGMGTMLDALSHLVSLCNSRVKCIESDRITALMLMGQVLIFRVGRAAVNTHLEWKEPHSDSQSAAIRQTLESNIRQVLRPLK